MNYIVTKYKPEEGDLLIYKEGEWIPVNIASLLSELNETIKSLKTRLNEAENKLKNIEGE